MIIFIIGIRGRLWGGASLFLENWGPPWKINRSARRDQAISTCSPKVLIFMSDSIFFCLQRRNYLSQTFLWDPSHDPKEDLWMLKIFENISFFVIIFIKQKRRCLQLQPQIKVESKCPKSIVTIKLRCLILQNPYILNGR